LKLRFYKKRLWLWCRSILARDPEVFCQYGLNVKIPVTADLSIRYNLARGGPYEAAEAAEAAEANLINTFLLAQMFSNSEVVTELYRHLLSGK
jgi:hypothetical protein